MRLGVPTLWRSRPRPLERLSSPILLAIVWVDAWCLGRFVPYLWLWLALLVLGAKCVRIVAWRGLEYERLFRQQGDTE